MARRYLYDASTKIPMIVSVPVVNTHFMNFPQAVQSRLVTCGWPLGLMHSTRIGTTRFFVIFLRKTLPPSKAR